jgi:hypothetical protein
MSRAAGYIAELAAQAVVPALPRSTFRQVMPCRSCVVTLPAFVFFFPCSNVNTSDVGGGTTWRG